jgi:3-oxoacyl-[acyl-carrier protein] reductase
MEDTQNGKETVADAKVVLVTGGSSGIGRATCFAFSERGFKVALHYHSGYDRAKSAVENIISKGGDAFAVPADLRSGEQIKSLIEAVKTHYHRLDILINNAGDPIMRIPFQDVDETTLDDVLAINLKAPFLLTQAALPLLMESHGVVINVSSALTTRPSPSNFSHYVAAKGGINSLTVALASELSPLGIRVNCVCPGVVDSELQRRLSTPERLKQMAGHTLLKRIGTPEEIAEIIVFLASDGAGYIVGQCIFAAGG